MLSLNYQKILWTPAPAGEVRKIYSEIAGLSFCSIVPKPNSAKATRLLLVCVQRRYQLQHC